MYLDNVPKRVWEYNPGMKLIVILRNPIERAYSHWNMVHSKGNDAFPFWEAINKEKERCLEAYPLQHMKYSYIDRGFYLKQLKRLWTYFPRDMILILKVKILR